MARSRHRRKSQMTGAFKKVTPLRKMDIADELLEDGKIEEARQVLEDLHRHHPSRSDVLQNLAYTCHLLGDRTSYLSYCIKLCRLTPNSAENVLALATAYTLNERPALALRTYRYFLNHWTQHPETENIGEIVKVLESGVQEMIAEVGFVGDEGLESAQMHEEVQVLLAENQYEEGRALAQRLIERHPRFAPVYNNLSMLQFFHGHSAEAIATARHVLSFDAKNFQATANLIRFLFLSGEREEAHLLASELKALHSENPDIWAKKMEAFSFLCDDEAVLEAFESAEKAGALKIHIANPLLYHLAAAAAWHLGRNEQAKQCWEQALSISQSFDLAVENLRDLSKPVGEGHGAWAYNLSYWLPRQRVDQMMAGIKSGGKSSAALTRSVRQFLDDHSDIIQLMPLLLERGDPQAAEFMVVLAGISKHAELLEAVKQFALGQRGSDQLRMRAAQLAVEEGLLPAGEIRMWMQGEWRDLLLMAMEITGEPAESNIPSKAKQLFLRAWRCLQDNHGAEAEILLKEAREIAPNDPSILNNLAAAYKLQGRKEEYHQLAQEIHEKHPDYFFGCIQMAGIYGERGEMDKAKELLDPLLQRKKLHVSEMAALCSAQIELLLKEGRRDSARSWFQIFEQVCPEHPHLEIFRPRVQKLDWRQLLNLPFGR
jgi:tetratricopeptide (TPR) repeat protein